MDDASLLSGGGVSRASCGLVERGSDVSTLRSLGHLTPRPDRLARMFTEAAFTVWKMATISNVWS